MSDMHDAVLLSVRSLRTRFFGAEGEFTAVDGVSFDVRRGETLAVVGESGSGKSVTALSILGLLPRPEGRVTEGAAMFDGMDLLQLSAPDMRKIRGNRIAMIFQEPMSSLNPVLRIGDQIAEALVTHRRMSRSAARETSVELLRKVNIASPEQRVDDYPHRLSGGMRQRVMIAMALSCQPSLLIADEPTTALDVTIQAQILDLLARLRSEIGMAMLLITHDLGIVREQSDAVVVMYAGRIVERADVDALFTRPQHPYTRSLVAVVERLERGEGGALSEPVPVNVPRSSSGCPYVARCSERLDACRVRRPELVDVASGHAVACFNRSPIRSPA
jgi:oligopeptide/dipeptide ABC transporter ATP-binding protein